MKQIFTFLEDITLHNDRTWFSENRSRYDAAQDHFVKMAEQTIAGIGLFDPAVADIPVKSTLYRFHRDTRFSPDKSPYKRHFGCYINPKGKKSQHGGYYLHIQPGNCLVAGGAYCLESPILKAVRQSIVDNPETFRNIVEEEQFKRLFPVIGENRLKTIPAGFSRDFPYPQYLQPKDYSVFTPVPDSLFYEKNWCEEVCSIFRIMKPFLDFVNDTIDDMIP